MVELNNIVKYFNAGTVDEVKLFDQFCLSIPKGQFVSIIGSNGSGKTTLLNLVSGSLAPDDGEILFDGQAITKMPEYKRARFIGRVFQDPKMGTCSDLTILENLALADNKGRPFGLTAGVNKARRDYFRERLAVCGMGLENRLNTLAGSLSGGQRQALALVIAGMSDIELLILDEHTAALDPKSSHTVMQLTDQLVKEKGVTTLMVTHNLRFALEYGNRLVMMHQGGVVKDLAGEQKEKESIDNLLHVFNEISIECGN